MRKLLKKDWFAAGALTAAVETVVMTAACLLIVNLSSFLSGEPQLARIFAQLRSARLMPPLWQLLPAYGALLPAVKLWRGKHRLWSVLISIATVALLLLGAVYCTRVNDILFGDVLVSLLETMQKGGLEGL